MRIILYGYLNLGFIISLLLIYYSYKKKIWRNVKATTPHPAKEILKLKSKGETMLTWTSSESPIQKNLVLMKYLYVLYTRKV